jgi:hypothetical protein
VQTEQTPGAFILPIDERLMTKLREKSGEYTEKQQQMRLLFEMKFKRMVEMQKVRAHLPADDDQE